jgi:hypothetical protein
MDDGNFALKISHNGISHIFTDFGFSIIDERILTGVEVVAEAYHSGSILYLDHIKVKCYYGNSVVPIVPGSQAYASDGRKPGEGEGDGTGVMVFYDGADK